MSSRTGRVEAAKAGRDLTKAAPMADNGGMAKILVVEDNASMREMLTSIIAEKGFETENAACVGDALALLKKNDFALIVSDLQLPDMDGLSFCKKIKHLQIPFIILTAFGSIEKAVEAIKEGAFDFIAKPVDPDYLLLMIDKALAATQIAARKPGAARSAAVGNGQNRHHRQQPRNTQGSRKDPPGRPDQHHRPAARRKRHRQGTIRPGHPRPEPAAKIGLSSPSIRRRSPTTFWKMSFSATKKAPTPGPICASWENSNWPRAALSFLTRSAISPIHLQGKILRVLEEKSISRLGSSKDIRARHPFHFRHQPGPGKSHR